MSGAGASGASDSRAGPWLAFSTCCAIWGSTFLFIRIGNDTVPPAWAATLRLTLAALLLNLIRVLRRQPWPKGPAREAALWFGLLNFGASMSLLYWGETRVPSGLTAVVYAIAPLATAVFAWWLGMERLDPRRIAGALIGLAGVGIIFSDSLRSALPARPLLAVLGSVLCASLGSALLRRGPPQSPIVVNAVAATVGLPITLLASFALGESHALPRNPAGIASILYLTVAGSLIAFVVFAWLVQRWPVTRVSFIAVIVPVIALALGALVRHERFSSTALAGSAVVMGGVALGLLPSRAARRGT